MFSVYLLMGDMVYDFTRLVFQSQKRKRHETWHEEILSNTDENQRFLFIV